MERSQPPNRAERGIVLFLTLMALLVVAALATAIILLASGESTEVGKQRSSTRAYYAASAGLEEARARLLGYHPAAFSKVTPALSLPTAVGQVVYIVNPAGGEVVSPTDLSPTNPYADTEYQTEFGTAVTSASSVRTVTSAQPVVSGVLAIPYKWVRITVKTERAANADINADAVFNNTIPVRFGGNRQRLDGVGNIVYRMTALAVLPNGSRQMAQTDVVGISSGGFDYALAAGNACQLQMTAAMTIRGKLRCNSEVIVDGPLTVIDGNVESYTVIEGSGSIALDGTHQARANGQITTTVTGGGSPNQVSAPGTVQQLLTPATPTPAPLAPNTMPNPDANNIIPAVTQTNPAAQCIAGKVVFDLGNTNPPQVWEFNGSSYPSPCGGTINPQNFGTNVEFRGKGTIWFSSNQSIDFHNDFGTAAQPLEINIVARPLNNSVGQDTISFYGNVINIAGLLYTHGEVYTKCGSPGQLFHVSGSLLSYKDPNQLGPTHNGDFGAGSCTSSLDIAYNPTQLAANPPPGFDGLLGGSGNTGSKLLNWRGVMF